MTKSFEELRVTCANEKYEVILQHSGELRIALRGETAFYVSPGSRIGRLVLALARDLATSNTIIEGIK